MPNHYTPGWPCNTLGRRAPVVGKRKKSGRAVPDVSGHNVAEYDHTLARGVQRETSSASLRTCGSTTYVHACARSPMRNAVSRYGRVTSPRDHDEPLLTRPTPHTTSMPPPTPTRFLPAPKGSPLTYLQVHGDVTERVCAVHKNRDTVAVQLLHEVAHG